MAEPLAALDDGRTLDVLNKAIIGPDGIVGLRAVFIVDPNSQRVIATPPEVGAGEAFYSGEVIGIASTEGALMTITVNDDQHGFTWNAWRERAVFLVASGYLMADKPDRLSDRAGLDWTEWVEAQLDAYFDRLEAPPEPDEYHADACSVRRCVCD